MTPEQLEHLRLLKKHLENLLATAEKRTPGEWLEGHKKDGDIVSTAQKLVADTCFWSSSNKEIKANATYIASCAGNAEAGWQSTLAAIDLLLEMERQGCSFSYFPTAESILAEWPLASLKP